MHRTAIYKLLAVTLALVLGTPAELLQAGNLRGMPANQTAYFGGYYGRYAPAQVYYVPAQAPQTAYYAPAYAQQPYATSAYYPQQVAVPTARTAYYAPPINYAYARYAPVTAYSLPAATYAVTPAGGSTAGAEAYGNYGQAIPVNYATPAYQYQTRMVQVPVTYYRPVTVYDPVTAQPTTCLKACTTTQCQPSRFRLFPWFRRTTCGTSGSCGTASTTAYCNPTGCGTSNCGAAPYYNATPQPVGTIPLGSAPVGSFPSATPPRGLRGILNPPTTVPPPGTRVIVPSGSGNAVPGGTFPSGGQPGFVPSGGGTSVEPADIAPAIQPGGSRPSTFPGTTPSPPAGSFRGSGFRGELGTDTEAYNGPKLNRPTISEPGSAGAQPNSLRPVPDPDANRRVKPSNRAPALINPGDRTATQAGLSRVSDSQTWAVIPATWPTKSPYQNASSIEVREAKMTQQPLVPTAPQEEVWDDSGWKSARQ